MIDSLCIQFRGAQNSSAVSGEVSLGRKTEVGSDYLKIPQNGIVGTFREEGGEGVRPGEFPGGRLCTSCWSWRWLQVAALYNSFNCTFMLFSDVLFLTIKRLKKQNRRGSKCLSVHSLPSPVSPSHIALGSLKHPPSPPLRPWSAPSQLSHPDWLGPGPSLGLMHSQARGPS